LPDRDLAVFLSDTKEMDAYLSDLYWAQEYASRNRAVMEAQLIGKSQPSKYERAATHGGEFEGSSQHRLVFSRW